MLGVPVAVVVATVVLTTPSAEARALQAMKNALTDVQSMRTTIYLQRGGKSRLFGYTHTKDGTWRTEGFIGTPLHKAWIFDDHRQYMVDIARRVTTVEPRVIHWFPSRTALDYVIAETDTGPMGLERSLKRIDGPVENGRRTYQLIFYKERFDNPRDFGSENSRATITVDADTNLPIRSEVRTELSDRDPSLERREYEFNVTLPTDTFQPPYPPFIDLLKVQNERVAQWRANPLAGNGRGQIVDAQVNEKGALFLLSRGTDTPNAVVAADGTRYVYATEFRPGGTRGDTATQARCGDLKVTIFVPIEAQPSRPIFRVTIGPRLDNGKIPSEKDLGDGVSISAKPCPNWPDYHVDLMLDDALSFAAERMAAAPAKPLAEEGKIDLAVQHYKLAYSLMRKFLHSIAYQSLKPAEKLLRENGRIAEADELAKTIAAEEAIDPNVRHDPPAKP
jgi:outer membrane lipoprotein-sorting protein